jgi:PAS domain S-box-containing protein
MYKNSIKIRVTVVTLAILVALVCSLAFYGYRSMRYELTTLISGQQYQTVMLAANQIDQQLMDRQTALEAVARQAPLHDRATLQSYLSDKPALDEFFSGGLFVVGTDGALMAEHPAGVSGLYEDYKLLSAVDMPLTRGIAHISVPQPVMADGGAAFAIGVPVRTEDGIQAVMVGVIDLARASFIDALAYAKFGEAGGFFLVARQERLIIAATDAARIMQTLVGPGQVPAIDHYIDGYEGSKIYVNAFGTEVLVSGKHLTAAEWGVAADIPTAEVFAPVTRLRTQLLLVSLAVTFLAAIATWWMLRREFNPLMEASVKLAQLAGSDALPQVQSLDVARPDEIGNLFTAFNRLLSRLAERELALKASESKLAAILDGVDAAIYLKDRDGRFLFANRKLAETFGVSAESIIGRHPGDFVDMDSAAAFSSVDERVWQTGECFRAEEHVRWPGPSGESTFMSVKKLLHNEHGIPYALIGISTDITVLKHQASLLQLLNTELTRHRDHLEEKVRERTRDLVQARDRAESADRAKSVLLSNISHELRTPLNHILGFASLLATHKGEASPVYAEAIVTAAEELTALVEDVIDMAQLEADGIVIQRQPLDLQDLLARQTVRVRPAAQSKGLSLSLELPQVLPGKLLGDRKQLEAVLGRLLDNAVKFSDAGHVTLSCTTRSITKHDVLVGFEVSDQGIGVDEGLRARLFQLFEPGDASIRKRYAGTGLGLAYVHRLVSLMQGEIGLESQPGKGSTFWFTVALELADDALPIVDVTA